MGRVAGATGGARLAGRRGLIVHEDDHILVVDKPAGLNMHSPERYAGEGLFEWLRDREPRWARLSIVHRLDKETSGVVVLAKTDEARRSLTRQFATRAVQKVYTLLTDRPVKAGSFTVESAVARMGARYVARPWPGQGSRAVTRFTISDRSPEEVPIPAGARSGVTLLIAEPETGRTHQIRAQAAASGCPVLGDVLYGGTPAARVYLHAERITFAHPATGDEVTFDAPADFAADPRLALREAIIDPGATDAYRLIHGAADGFPGWYVDRLGDFLLSQSEGQLGQERTRALEQLLGTLSLRGAYHRPLRRDVRLSDPGEASPRHVIGDQAPERFVVRENGVRYELSFNEGYSVGLFLDQRDNRRRFLIGHVAAGFPPLAPLAAGAAPFVLNTFAYTCGFSVCAAIAGMRVTSLDLSRKYLEWGRRNLVLNGLDPGAHDFSYGDVFDWLKRLTRRGRVFSMIILDPPTFSSSRQSGVFRAEKDYGRLVGAAVPLLAPDGVILASSNAARLDPEAFLRAVREAVTAAGRPILAWHYAPQPPDFPIARGEPAHLKTIWLRLGPPDGGRLERPPTAML